MRTVSKYENDDLVIPKVTELALRYLVQQAKPRREALTWLRRTVSTSAKAGMGDVTFYILSIRGH